MRVILVSRKRNERPVSMAAARGWVLAALPLLLVLAVQGQEEKSDPDMGVGCSCGLRRGPGWEERGWRVKGTGRGWGSWGLRPLPLRAVVAAEGRWVGQ